MPIVAIESDTIVMPFSLPSGICSVGKRPWEVPGGGEIQPCGLADFIDQFLHQLSTNN